MNTGLILDVAHGSNVPGKQSPDGKHKEYKWSRDLVRMLIPDLLDIVSPKFDTHSPYLDFDEEPGLIKRVKYYNEISMSHEKVLMLSFHNDANPKDNCGQEGYGEGHGIALWTSRGETGTDPIATFMFEEYKKMLPEEHFRTAYWLNKGEKVKDPDWEANFTILAGNDKIKPLYDGILLEVLFQNNREDLKKLKSFDWNVRFKNITKDVIIKTMIFIQHELI